MILPHFEWSSSGSVSPSISCVNSPFTLDTSGFKRNYSFTVLVHKRITHQLEHYVGGAVASWSVCLTLDRVVRVRVLAGDIVLCSWARHFKYSYGASLHPGV